MSSKLNRHAYEALIEQDVERVEKEMPDSLERNHVIAVLRDSVRWYYESARPEEKDMVLVPRELTAENGMKLALSGEFIVRPDTESDFEYIVPWDTIKEIHRRIVATSSPLAPHDRAENFAADCEGYGDGNEPQREP